MMTPAEYQNLSLEEFAEVTDRMYGFGLKTQDNVGNLGSSNVIPVVDNNQNAQGINMNDLTDEQAQAVATLVKLDDCGEQYNPAQGKFRIQNNKLILTYKSQIPKEEYKEWLKKKVASYKQCEMAHEIGESTGIDYAHTHVLIDFGRSLQTTNVRFFDYKVGEDSIHPNIRKVKTNAHWDNCLNYLAKEDPDNAHLAKTLNIAQGIWACKNVQEAMVKFCKKPSDAAGIIALYTVKARRSIQRIEPRWNPWQVSLRDMLLLKPDHYTIDWVFGVTGMEGKTTFSQWMNFIDPDKYLCIQGCASAKDLATFMESTIDAGKWTEEHCIFINLTRSKESSTALYNMIEALKDGDLSAFKFRGGVVQFNRPHIVILANFLPRIDALSLPRWKIWEITPGEHTSQELRRMTLEQVRTSGLQMREESSLLSFVG